jgi:hypothetical protein
LLDVYLDDAHQAAAASAELRGARSAGMIPVTVSAVV